MSREAWLAAGEHGLIGWEFDEKYGGLGVKDFRFNQIVSEEMFLTGSVGIGLGVQNDILVPYLNDLTTEEQKERWLPKFVSGEYIGSIAMSNPRPGPTWPASRPPRATRATTGWSTARRPLSATACCPSWC